MKLSKLEKASHYEVEKYFVNKLDLTPYQKDRLRDMEYIRLSPFYFYKRRVNSKSNILIRASFPLFAVYVTILYIVLPLKWLVTSEWGYGEDFINKFYSPWASKLGL